MVLVQRGDGGRRSWRTQGTLASLLVFGWVLEQDLQEKPGFGGEERMRKQRELNLVSSTELTLVQESYRH